MSYVTIYDTAIDETHVLRKQVATACADAAIDVINEDPGTPGHEERMRFARSVLREENGPVTMAAAMIWEVLQNPTIGADPLNASDNDVQFAVNGLIDIYGKA